MKKAIIKFLMICMAFNIVSPIVLAEGEQTVNVTELLNATFDDKVENSTAANTYWGDKLKVSDWLDNEPKYIKDPNGERDGLCVSSKVITESHWFSAYFSPQNTTKTAIMAENTIYISMDLYLPSEFSGSLDLRLDSHVNNVSIGRVIFGPSYTRWTYDGGYVQTDGAPATDKWYRIGILEDKTNKKISYFLDGEPIEGAQNVSGWSGTGTGIDRIFCNYGTQTQDYVICFDNISVYSVPELDVSGEIYAELDLPETVAVTTENGMVVNEQVVWDISEIDMSKEGEYSLLGKLGTKNSFVCANVKVTDKIKTEMELLQAKINENTATQEECLALYEKLINASGYTMRESYMAQINNYINTFSDETVSQSPSLAGKIPAKTDKIVLNYDRILKDDNNVTAEIKDSDGNVIRNSLECKENSLVIALEDSLDINESYEITVTNLKDAFGNALQNDTVSFITKMIDVNVEDGNDYGQGKVLTWKENDEITVSCVIKKDGTAINISNNYRFNDVGTVEVVLTANNGAETESFVINILEAYAPKAENVRIETEYEVETGVVLEGKYEFSDLNNEKEKGSIYKWYRNDELIDGATEKYYTLTEADEDKDIYFEVTPVADSDMKSVGETVKSDAFTGAYKPTASNVKIIIGDSNVLEGKYDYSDKNADEKGVSEYKWIFIDPEKKENVLGTDSTFTIPKECIDGKIIFEVTPVSVKKPYKGNPVRSEGILTPARPKADNVKITGSAVVGNTLSGTYNWSDVNGDSEGDTKERWVNASTGAVVEEGAVINLSASLKGETICFEVIPVSAKEPYEGTAVRSEPITVKGKSTSGSSGGGSGSSGGSGFVYVPVNKDKTDIQPQPGTETSFEDIKNHWAEKYITELNDEGIVEGVTKTLFEPDRSIKRAEFIALIMRALDKEISEYSADFADVDKEFWASGYIQTALDVCVISEDEKFRPNDFIIREEAAKVISLVTDYMIADESVNAEDFADFGEISDWAKPYADNAAQKGLIVGDENNMFNPKSELTRAQAAAVIWRMR